MRWTGCDLAGTAEEGVLCSDVINTVKRTNCLLTALLSIRASPNTCQKCILTSYDSRWLSKHLLLCGQQHKAHVSPSAHGSKAGGAHTTRSHYCAGFKVSKQSSGFRCFGCGPSPPICFGKHTSGR